MIKLTPLYHSLLSAQPLRGVRFANSGTFVRVEPSLRLGLGWSEAYASGLELKVLSTNYGAVTTHGSVAMPVPLAAVVPGFNEIAGRTPFALFTLL